MNSVVLHKSEFIPSWSPTIQHAIFSAQMCTPFAAFCRHLCPLTLKMMEGRQSICSIHKSLPKDVLSENYVSTSGQGLGEVIRNAGSAFKGLTF